MNKPVDRRVGCGDIHAHLHEQRNGSNKQGLSGAGRRADHDFIRRRIFLARNSLSEIDRSVA